VDDVSNYHWSKDIQLKMSICTSNGDSYVVSDDLCAAHSKGLTLSWVDFTRHNRTARFIFRQKKFSQTTTRTRSQETDIVSNFHECASSSVKSTREFHESIIALESFEFVWCSCEFIASFNRYLFSDGLCETLVLVGNKNNTLKTNFF